MVSAVIAIHVLVCIALTVVILLQQGKGADIGAVFGGSSQTVFGASGAGNALTQTTWVLAGLFFITSLFLAYSSTQRVTGSIFGGGHSSSVMPSSKQPVAPQPAQAPAAPAPVPAGGASSGKAH